MSYDIFSCVENLKLSAIFCTIQYIAAAWEDGDNHNFIFQGDGNKIC